MSYIRLEDVSYEIRGRRILDHIDLGILNKAFITIIGANGAGKTTLTKLILGILKPTSGNVFIDNKNIRDYERHEIGSKVGYLFQNPSLQIFAPTIKEELSFALEYKGINKAMIDKKAEDMIEKFSLHNAINTPTFHLSRGEKQRLAIGTMLMNNPEFIILDEPTTGLDYKQKKVLEETLIEIYEDGIGILLISHDQGFIKRMPGDIVEIRNGRLNHE